MNATDPLNMMVEQLISEIEQSFSDITSVKKAIKQYRNGGSNALAFAKSLAPHSSKINEHKDVNILGIPWHLCSENSREALFQHLKSIAVFGGAVGALPVNTMGAIENLAAKCAKELDGPPTIQNVLNAVQKNADILQDVFKGLGVGSEDMVQGLHTITQEEQDA